MSNADTMKLADLKLRLRALFAARRAERDLHDELAFHLECERRKLMARGIDAAEAGRRARASFGPVALAADRCRDARGTAFVDTLVRDVRFALRTFRRAPLVAATVIATIAAGLGVVAVAFTFFNAFFFRVDAVRNPHELFAVVRPLRPGSGSEVRFRRREYEAIRRDTNVFTGVAAARPSVSSRLDGRPARGTFVSGNFFDLLGVTAERGRVLTPADNDDGGRPFIVLSHHGWEKLLGSDPGVVGRGVLLNGHPYQIAGVMPDGFRGLSQELQDYWAPLALVDEFAPDGTPDETWVDVIGRLPSGSPDAAAAALTAWASAQPDIRKAGNGIVHVVLREDSGVLSKDRGVAMAAFAPIFFAFGLILMIGCANVANLLLARGLSRQREVGVRLSLGATRGRIVRQLLTESLLLALVAAGLGFLVSRALLAGSVHLALTLLPPEFAESLDVVVPPADWRVVLFLFGGAFASTVMFGLVPALNSTRLELVRAMRGEITRDARPGRVRHLLIGTQVTASALLLVCAAVFLRSSYSASTKDAGLRTSDTLLVEGVTEASRPALVRAIQNQPSVAALAASWPEPMNGGESSEASVDGVTLEIGSKFVSPEYFDLLGIDLLKGRVFAPEERTAAAGVVVISDALAHRLWPRGDALGQIIRLGGSSPQPGTDPTPRVPARSVMVIGVVRDVRSAISIFDIAYSGIYLPATLDQAKTSLVVRVHGDPDNARRQLLETLTKIDPALGDVRTMRMLAGLESAVLHVIFWMAVILGGLALALTVSGLFSVLSYLVEQRRKEIGVRMALGASARHVAVLVVSQSMRPIAAGVVAGGGLAAAAALVLLSTPMAEGIGSAVHAFDPFAYSAGLGVIVITCVLAACLPAVRAARLDPMTTLRAD